MESPASASSFASTSLDEKPEVQSSTRPSPSDDVAGSVFFISAAGELLRLPIPSDSPRDPLAWTWPTRITAYVCVCLLSVAASVTVNTPSAIQPGVTFEFPDVTNNNFAPRSLTSAITLFLSIGYIVAIPVSTGAGRRPVMLFAIFMLALCNLWAGLSCNFDSLIAAICFQGFAIGGILSMCLLIIMDATFIHERPYAFSIFWCTNTMLISFAFFPFPHIMDPAKEWRPIYYLWFGLCLIIAVLAFLFVPETYFIRPAVALDGRILVQSSTEKVQIYDDWESIPCGPDCPHHHVHDEAPGPSVWGERLRIRQAPGAEWKSIRATYAQMLLCLTNPLLVWVSLLSAAILSQTIFNITAVPDYLAHNMPRAEVEMMTIYMGTAGFVAALVALPMTGPLISWFARYFTLRSGGTRHAEAYLPGFVLPVLSGSLALGLFALGSANRWPALAFYFSFGLTQLAYISSNVAVVLWITEAFQPWASASLAVQLFTYNMVAFGVSINLLAWVTDDVTLVSSMVIMALVLVLGAFAVPVAFWGKSVRQYIHGRWSESTKGAIRPR